MVVRLDYDSPQALMKTIVMDFARAIVYVYVSLSASELVRFIAEEVPYLVTIRSLKMVALCSELERTDG